MTKCKLLIALMVASAILAACGGDDNGGNNGSNGGNASPRISLNEDNLSVAIGDDVVLDASASSDPDGGSLSFNWSGVDGIASPTEAITVISDLPQGVHQVILTVSDGERSVTATVTIEVTGPQITVSSGIDTGTISEPVMAFYDLDTGTTVDITQEEAAANEEWDIAFLRTKIYLNRFASTPVTLHFTGNTDEFYDASGTPIVERFVNASADSELSAFTAISADLSEDTEFNGDTTEAAIANFYLYDVNTHTTSANVDSYFVVDSDATFSKFHVTDLVQDGFGIASLTLAIANHTAGDLSFGSETELEIDASSCNGDLYVDLAARQLVEADDEWDLSLPCADGLADYAINIAEDAFALNGEDAEIPAVVDANLGFYNWVQNENDVLAIVAHGDSRSVYGWAEYALAGGHLMWPNYATYLIQTAEGLHKFQIVNYYDVETGASGSFTVRHQLILDQ